MKRAILCGLVFMSGLAVGATIQYTQHWQAGYRRGYVTAMANFQREAVREGHGHWERRDDLVSFQWNNSRPAYHPDTSVRIRGLE